MFWLDRWVVFCHKCMSGMSHEQWYFSTIAREAAGWSSIWQTVALVAITASKASVHQNSAYGTGGNGRSRLQLLEVIGNLPLAPSGVLALESNYKFFNFG